LKPDEFLDGHPQSLKLDLFEAFVQNIVDEVKAERELFAETAIVVTFDEGGGHYDSGFIQPVDFLGDGPRIPAIMVSPFSTGGRVVHSDYDHGSAVKFIERDWRLTPLTNRRRDNLPNPPAGDDNPYVPTNMPAIGDLFDSISAGGTANGIESEANFTDRLPLPFRGRVGVGGRKAPQAAMQTSRWSRAPATMMHWRSLPGPKARDPSAPRRFAAPGGLCGIKSQRCGWHRARSGAITKLTGGVPAGR
jgi:hypothetical protein